MALHATQQTKRLAQYLLLAGLLLFTLFPVYWMVAGSFKPQNYIMELPGIIPHSPTLANYTSLPSPLFPFLGIGLKNGLIVTLSTAVLSLFVSSLAAYGISQFRFRGNNLVLLGIMATQIFPGVVLVLAFYIFYAELHLLNTYQGLILAYTSFTIPFAVWLLKSFFDDLPVELIDAVQVDGGSRLQALRYVALPLVAPGLLATFMFVFLVAWDEFLFSLTLTTTNEMRTMAPALIMTFFMRYNYRWGPMMAASVVVGLPVLVMFFFLQRYLVKGLTTGAVKG
jgi:multiple sugar transport system permease protein